MKQTITISRMDGSDTGIFGLNPSTMAVVIIILFIVLWVAYTWYYGGVTVPLPSYAVGFQGSENPEESEEEKKPEGLEGLEGFGPEAGPYPTRKGVEGFGPEAGPYPTRKGVEGFGPEAGPYPTRKGVEGFLGSRFTTGNSNKKPRDLTKHLSKPVQIGKDAASSGFHRLMQGFTSEGKEGFFGGAAHGAGSPSCLRTSAESAQLIDMFTDKVPRFEEGPDSLRELTILMGKLACFKKDLVSPSFIVNATKNQPYTTTHDIEPISETTGRCFSKTISPRDLSISLDKWNERGETLVKKLCTAYSLNEKEVESAQSLFRYVIRDVSDIARGSCLQGEPMIAGKPGPRDAHPYEKPNDSYGEFQGYY